MLTFQAFEIEIGEDVAEKDESFEAMTFEYFQQVLSSTHFRAKMHVRHYECLDLRVYGASRFLVVLTARKVGWGGNQSNI
jgi:hypothetical protein